jgi:hypothetical protein
MDVGTLPVSCPPILAESGETGHNGKLGDAKIMRFASQRLANHYRLAWKST